MEWVSRLMRNLRGPLILIGLWLVALPIFAVGCGGDDDGEDSVTTATEATAEAPDLTALPLGDGKYSDSPRVGYIYSCQGDYDPESAGAAVDGPWINQQAGTWNAEKKVAVPGEVDWPSRFDIELDGEVRRITGNDLPEKPTGEFPIPSDSEAYQYDRNPNEISEQEFGLELPATPTEATEPSCMGGEVGVVLDGAALYNGFDAGGQDANAHEVQDDCDGHPQVQSVYHYHSQGSCIEDNEPGEGHSPLIGYALDGFGIYGHHGENGEVLTTQDLDECHGHSHQIDWDGETIELYHYHSTYEFPYTVSCFRAEPAAMTVVTSSGTGGQQAGGAAPQGAPPEGGPPAGAPPPP